jgi:tetratricopeptide (TPR) repeat protein
MNEMVIGGDEAAAERSSLAAALRRRVVTAVAYLPHAATLLAVLCLSFLSGGYILSSTTPVVLAYGGVMLLWFWLAPKRLVTPRVYVVALVAFALFVLWTGASIVWSIGPDLSWVAFDYAAAYLLVAWVAGTARVGRGQLRFVAYGFLLTAVAVAVYAYLGKVLPDVVTHAHQEARLSAPLGYYNVLALMMVMALPIALEVASRRAYNPIVRALAAMAMTLLALTFFFAFSRGGFVALAVCLVAYFALSTRRLGGLLALACGTLPVVAILLAVRSKWTLFNATLDDALRTMQGHSLLRWSLLALVIAFALQLGVALAHRRVAPGRRAQRALGTAVAVLLLAALVFGAAAYFGPRGGVAHWAKQHYQMFTHDSTVSGAGAGPSRLLSFSTGRPDMWREGIKQFHHNPTAGTGAGTFRFTHDRFRVGEGVVKHAHSEWINVLSELGVIGLGLYVLTIGLLLVAMLRRLLRDRDDKERALLAALQAACIAFVVHISWDWDWDMAAITFVFLLLAGTAASYVAARGRAAAATQVDGEGEAVEPSGDIAAVEPHAESERTVPPARGRRFGPAARTLACGLVLLGGVSWTLPYLSERAFSRAVEQAGKQHLAAAVASARQAHRLDPLAVDPLITLAQVQQQLALAGDALKTLTEAQKLQPQNFEVYYQMALLLSTQFGRDRAAAAELRKALALNPNDSSMRYLLSSLERR